ncbi:MAK10-like protein [Tanacetum coccineum]
MERAATTASSLEAKQDSGSGPRCQDTILGDVDVQTRFETTSKQFNDPSLSKVNTFGSGDDTAFGMRSRKKRCIVLRVKVGYAYWEIWDECHESYRNTIELLEGNNVAPLRSDTIRLVQNICAFHGLRSEDPNQHLKDFLKLVDSLDLNVPSTSDHRLIDLENQVQRFMESHLAPKPSVQVNKITSSCKICGGPHDTQYCMENHEQAFVDYASPRTDKVGVLAHAPMYNAILDKYVKSLKLGKNGSAFIQIKMPKKIKDPRLLILPSRLGDSKPFDTLADLGSCVNLISLYLFKTLKIRLLEEIENVLGLADGTKSYPVGIVRNVEVYVGELKLLEDFYVIDMEKDPTCPLLVGRGFLATASAIIDCKKSKIAVGEGITRSIFRVKEIGLAQRFNRIRSSKVQPDLQLKGSTRFAAQRFNRIRSSKVKPDSQLKGQPDSQSKVSTGLAVLQVQSDSQLKAILSGADNHPPMLEKDMYDSWKSIMELYMMNRRHGRMILESVENGPLIWPTIEEN